MSQSEICMLIMACKELLSIETDIRVEYRTKVGKGRLGKAAAYCWDTRNKGILKNFRLVINVPRMIASEYDSAAVIAHEMVHALMIEKNIFNPDNHHDEHYQKIAAELQTCLNKIGFTVGDLYSAATDTE